MYVLGIVTVRSVEYWVLDVSYIVLGHWVLGPYGLDITSRATTLGSYGHNFITNEKFVEGMPKHIPAK